jgi:hypothetical protein
LEYGSEKEIPQTPNSFCKQNFHQICKCFFYHMKCHIEMDAKLKTLCPLRTDKQVALLGFDPYGSGTTLNNQNRRKPLKLIELD